MYAFKHRKTGDLILAIRLEKEYNLATKKLEKGDWIVIAGHDKSAGVSDKIFHKVFQPFGEESTTEFGKWEEWDTD